MVSVEIKLSHPFQSEDIVSAVLEKLPVDREEILEWKLTRLALDTRIKPPQGYRATVALTFSEERERGLLKMRKIVRKTDEEIFVPPLVRGGKRPIVIGAGPAGLFAALTLAEAGLSPILFERGDDVDTRQSTVDAFLNGGRVDPESNVQFGEGGAGTFSDGKLKCGQKDKYKRKVLSTFVLSGAPKEILYLDAPHLGTDLLPEIVKRLRKRIIALGGEVHFRHRLVAISVLEDAVKAITVLTPQGERRFETDALFLATGHSARDVFRYLHEINIPMEAKGFGIGVRLEHPREYINSLVFGETHNKTLPTASYHLVTHLKNGRSVYSFCMCPGGTVVAAANQEGIIVTNGMSVYHRNGENSNAALLVSVTPDDFPSDSPLAGLTLQETIERAAYLAAGATGRAPAQRLSDFLADKNTESLGGVRPSYRRGVSLVRTDAYLPSFITDSLREAIRDFDLWMPGYNYPEAMITGPETRSTSPIRILRAEDGESPRVRGLYPVGEGAGYSGGIVSSAVDGIRQAERYCIFLLNNEKRF